METIHLIVERYSQPHTQWKSEMTYLNNGYDVMNCFAKFKKFLPHAHGITIPSFMCVESQMLKLDRELLFCPSSYKIGGQNTPCKLGLILLCVEWKCSAD